MKDDFMMRKHYLLLRAVNTIVSHIFFSFCLESFVSECLCIVEKLLVFDDVWSGFFEFVFVLFPIDT